LLRRRLRRWRRGHDFVVYLYRPGEICWRCGKARALPHAWDRQIDEDVVEETFKAFWLASNRT
jgi:hypothetical protein